jgi:hypothetical protein
MTSEVIARPHHRGTHFQPNHSEEEIMTETQSVTATMKFSPEFWAAFWAAPTMSHSMDILADDIIGYWPGDTEPVRGYAAYTQKIADILDAAPDLRLELIDSATAAGAAEGEELFFLHYVGHGTGPNGPIEIRGLDRVRTRDGVVVENVIRYDPLFLNEL